jgi:hypothetical protein
LAHIVTGHIRQLDDEVAPLTGHTVDLDLPSMKLDDPTRY